MVWSTSVFLCIGNRTFLEHELSDLSLYLCLLPFFAHGPSQQLLCFVIPSFSPSPVYFWCPASSSSSPSPLFPSSCLSHTDPFAWGHSSLCPSSLAWLLSFKERFLLVYGIPGNRTMKSCLSTAITELHPLHTLPLSPTLLSPLPPPLVFPAFNLHFLHLPCYFRNLALHCQHFVLIFSLHAQHWLFPVTSPFVNLTFSYAWPFEEFHWIGVFISVVCVLCSVERLTRISRWRSSHQMQILTMCFTVEPICWTNPIHRLDFLMTFSRVEL